MATNQPNKNIRPQSDPEILETVVDDFTRRLRGGEHPSISEYQERFPKLKDEIEDLLASVAMIEQLKSDPSVPNTNGRRSLDEVSSLQQIGSYNIKGEIGRGGMGVVFEAVHESLGRRVAIKVMPTPLVNSNGYVERFKREAQAAARLHHTNIVGVFGVGEGDGYHYYVMDLIDGQTLSEVVYGLKHDGASEGTNGIDETRCEDSTGLDLSISELFVSTSPTSQPPADPPAQLSDSQSNPQNGNPKHFRWAARIGANIAGALAYAHDQKILHRDIKPSNIILDRKGVVWITDFGLAKDNANEINLTKTGDVIGTPQYLAPESLEGTYDQRSEVYCLGLTLYELTTLQPAYSSGTTAEVIRAIATTSPVSPRKLNGKIPIDLSTIIDKAIARDPDTRYQSAGELQQDLAAFVGDRPISARPPSALENAVKWGRRNPLAAALSAISALLLTLVAVSASIGYLYTMDALGKEADKSAKLENQYKETERQRQAAIEAKHEAVDFATQMIDQFNRAEANVEITIAAFDEMFKQVVARGASANGELDIDGFEELQGIETSVTREDAAFLDKFLRFYDKFANQNADNESLQIESARAFRRVANIYQLVGEVQRSIDAYRKSIELCERAVAASPDSKDKLIALVQTKNELSRVYRRNQDWRNAVSQNENAIALLEDVPVEQLDNELKLELAKTFNSIGSSSAIISVMYNSASFDREWRSGPNGQPRGPENRRLPSWIEASMNSPGRNPLGRGPRGRGTNGRALGPRGQGGRKGDGRGGPESRHAERDRAGKANRMLGRRTNYYSKEAIKILDSLIAEEPDNVEFRSVRANCYCSLATSLVEPDPGQAQKMRNSAIDELESLIQQDSENSWYRYRLAMACSVGELSESSTNELKLMEKSVEIASELKEQFPQVLDYHYLYGSVRNKLAGQLIKSGNLEGALESLKMVKSSFEYVSDLSPTDRTYKITKLVLGKQLGALIAESEKVNNTTVAQAAKEMIGQVRQGGPAQPKGRIHRK